MTRKVRVATIASGSHGGPTIVDNRQRMAGLIEQALTEKPDIIALPESFTLANLSELDIEQMAEDISGPTLAMVAGYARKNRSYIICPLLARRDSGLYIEAFLLDRKGEIVGSYQKNHPVVEGSEFQKLEFDSRPGHGTPVLETDFGKIGIQICFDMHYPEGWNMLNQQGAEIIFWVSAYDGGKGLNAWAWNTHRYVISAVTSSYAQIIDIMGDLLAATGIHDPIAAYTIDLDITLFCMDFNKTQIPLIRARYGTDVNINIYHSDGFFTLQSQREGLEVGEIIREFKLEPLNEYIERNDRLQSAIRNGEPIPDLTPPYLGRTQYV